MNITMEQLRYDKTVCMDSETTVRVVAQLPELQAEDGATRELSVLGVNAQVYTGRCEVLAGEVQIEGVVKCCGVLAWGNMLASAGGSENFSYTAKLPGISPKANVNVIAQVKESTGQIENGRLVIDVTLILKLFTCTPNEINCVQSVDGANTHVLTGEVNSCICAGIFNSRMSVNEDIELSIRMPEVSKVLCSQTDVMINEVTCSNDQVMISGDIVLHLVYSCNDEYEPVAQIADKIGFSHVMDVRGVNSDMDAFVTGNVEDIYIGVNQNEQGEARVLFCEAVVNLNVMLMEREHTTLVMDAYSSTYELALIDKEVEYRDAVANMTAQQTSRLVATLPNGMPPMARISAVLVRPVIYQATAGNGMVTFEGTAVMDVFYIASATGEIRSFRAQPELSMVIDSPEVTSGCEIFFNVAMEHMQAVLLGSDGCEVRLTLNVTFSAYDIKKQQVLMSVEQAGLLENDFAIYIYITQKGENLWSVGKQLNVSVEELKRVNPDIDDNPPAGTRLIVYKQMILS